MTLWSAKGGTGLSVVAAGLAAAWARRGDSVLVDLTGDQPAICGLANDPAPGVLDWLREAPDAPVGALERLGCAVAARLTLLPAGAPVVGAEHPVDAGRLGAALRELAGHVVVDAGTARDAAGRAAVEEAETAVLVTRPCYLALRRAVSRGDVLAATDGVVVVAEPHRVLSVADVAGALGLPVLAVVPAHVDVVRAVDAGTLVTRPPRRLTRPLASLVDASPGRAAAAGPSTGSGDDAA